MPFVIVPCGYFEFIKLVIVLTVLYSVAGYIGIVVGNRFALTGLLRLTLNQVLGSSGYSVQQDTCRGRSQQ